MDSIQQAAMEKKSFELHYHGGTIWCEHLDGMGTYEDEVTVKFDSDKSIFSKPSVSSHMLINLDKTDITERIVEMIVSTILASDKLFRRIAFVGVKSRWRKPLRTIETRGIPVHFTEDYEKAKEWLFS